MHSDKDQGHSYQKYNSKNDRRSGHGYSSDHHYLSSPNGAPQGHYGHTDRGHSSSDRGHSTSDRGHSSSDRGHSSNDRSHSSNDRGYTNDRGHSSNDRGYSSSRNYAQKGYSKERDRDYKSRESRDKYPDSMAYSKEKYTKDTERDRDHGIHKLNDPDKKVRNNGGSSNSGSRTRYDDEAASSSSHTPGNEWSVHISSSGKRYYYNCITEVSQWEKPKEWSSKQPAYSSRSNHDKRPDARRKETDKNGSKGYARSEWNSNNSRDGHDRKRIKVSNHEEDNPLQNKEQTPERTKYTDKSMVSQAGCSKTQPHNSNEKSGPPIVVLDNSDQQTGSLLAAALPKIIQPTSTVGNDRGTPHRDAGPPTPTHSEHTDPHASVTHLETALPRKMESLGSYSSVVGNANTMATPMLTPSLVNYVRVDLTTHVTGWPSDLLEREAKRYSEEAYQDCLQCTRESAQLKCNRSVVRHLEIQATLQEQKITYIRQQIQDLEEMKTTKMLISQD